MDLGRSLRQALSKFTGAPVADEKAVKALCRELQRVLISSDVNVRLVFELTKRIENRALDANLPKGLSLREHVVKVVYEELAIMMGERYEPKISPKKILLLGQQDLLFYLRKKLVKECFEEFNLSTLFSPKQLEDFEIDALNN